MNKVANYDTITELPQEHIDYLNSVRGTNMNNMFKGCNALTSLDASNWDTSKVTDMSWMFSYCNALTSLDASNWDTSKVTDMSWMFYQCYSLTSLDISKWDTSQVTDMSIMFTFCSTLTSITGAINMSSCINCGSMFANCPKLKGVHLKNVPRNLDISNIGGTAGSTYIIDNYID